MRVVGAHRKRDFIDHVFEIGVFELEMLGVLYAVYFGKLLRGIATEFALAAFVIYFKARAVGGEHNGLRRQLFDEVAEKFARHNRVARFDDVGANHVFNGQFEVGSGKGERAVLRR